MSRIFNNLKNLFNSKETPEENLFPIDESETSVDLSDDAFIDGLKIVTSYDGGKMNKF